MEQTVSHRTSAHRSFRVLRQRSLVGVAIVAFWFVWLLDLVLIGAGVLR